MLTGSKRWIGLASIAQVAVIWAQTDGGIRGFLVPTDAPGFHTTVIEPKLSMRASIQCELHFDDVRLPAAALLPGARGAARAVLRAERSALRNRVGRARRRAGQLRGGPAVLAGAGAVRPADRGVPAHAAEARRHGRRAAEGGAPRAASRPPEGPGAAPAGADLARQAQQRARGHRDRARGADHPRRQRHPASRTARSGMPRTSSRCAPTRAPTRCTRSSSGST